MTESSLFYFWTILELVYGQTIPSNKLSVFFLFSALLISTDYPEIGLFYIGDEVLKSLREMSLDPVNSRPILGCSVSV